MKHQELFSEETDQIITGFFTIIITVGALYFLLQIVTAFMKGWLTWPL